MREKISGDLSGMVILWDEDSEKAVLVVLDGRNTWENMLGLSCWSMVEVMLKVVLGGKWTWKICWVWWEHADTGVAVIVNAKRRSWISMRSIEVGKVFVRVSEVRMRVGLKESDHRVSRDD